MPRVQSGAEVTIAVLTFKERWLRFFLEGIESSRQTTRYRLLFLANGASNEVKAALNEVAPDWIDFTSIYSGPEYIRAVYAGWNEIMLCAKTQWVILANDDMWMTDHSIDELVALRRNNPKALPCGLLVESGRINSGMPEFVKDFGTTPETFRRAEFLAHAASIRRPGRTEPGRLFQPVLFDRQQFFDRHGFPDGNIGGVSGDRILFERFQRDGFQWTTCLGSVQYHVQEGALRDV